MKLPPEKDRTITRRSVAGAAGGMKGVDYEDNRRAEPGTEPAASKSSKAAKLVREVRGEVETAPQKDQLDRTKGVVIENGKDYLDEEQIVDEVPKKKKRARGLTARDRLSVDKDAPELRRARKWAYDDEDEDSGEDAPEREDVGELEVSDERDRLEHGASPVAESRAHLFSDDRRPEPGDLTLTDPDEIAAVLGSPLAYAKHSMILAEAFRRTTGATRGEAIEYLARLFIAPSDRSFGRLAIKEFGPSSGILDIYPLEVIEHVLERYPAFLPKVGFGKLFVNLPGHDEETIFTDTKTPIVLEYPPELKIRSFAVSGGGRPGYLLEPALDEGKYQLHIYTSGKYRVLISAMNDHGYTTIDRLRIQVKPRKVEDLGTALGEAEYYPPRDEASVRAWPIPEVSEVPEELSADDLASIEEAVAEVVPESIDDTLDIDEDDEDEDEDVDDTQAVEITQRVNLDELDDDE